MIGEIKINNRTRHTDIKQTGNCDPCEGCGDCDRGRNGFDTPRVAPGNSKSSLNLRSSWTFFIVLLPTVLLGWYFIRPLLAPPLTPQELRGKEIYFKGISPGGGKIKAYIGKDRIALPGSAATCGSCHGSDGRGRPEAGRIPSDVTWDHLMKPYGHSHPLGRDHPAFTEASLKRSILNGKDPAGNQLESSMPTYAMSVEDINDLIAYLKRLQTDFDPGLEEKSIRIGTLLPAGGKTAAIGQGMVEVMAAYFEEINSRGGIYSRKLELIAAPYDTDGPSALAEATRLMDNENIFAVAGAVIAGADREMAELAEDKKVPLIGPFTFFSADPDALNEFTFYLYSGLNEQIRALVNFAVADLKLDNPRIAVLGRGDAHQKELQTAIAEQSASHGWTSLTGYSFAADRLDAAAAVRALKEKGVDCLFYLSFRGLKSLLEAAEAIDWRPHVFLPGALVQKEILGLPAGFQNKIYLAYPTLPSDQTPDGTAEFQALLQRHQISARHLTSQITAFVAAEILVEGLKRTGKDLSREKFMRSLEKLYDFQTGLTPRISYGPNRRIGALGSHIVTVDLENKNFTPVGQWVALSDRS
ncbi:MAG: ABC transporter substrate-binding protein [Desulfobacterales bacterium]|nr:ABC transporter substrate-binding protein [Desulfobacterales bacterium]